MKKKWIAYLLSVSIFAGSLLSGCGAKETENKGGLPETESAGLTETEESTGEEETTEETLPESPMIEANKGGQQVIDDKYRTFYEVFVYSFYDGNGDGVGDLKGLTEKLDYINDGDPATTDDLGFNGIWLMPVMPSTTYHKYDVIDYCDIDPEYGTLEDFKELMDQCHARGINVIIDFVMNHTSSKHEWFTTACAYLRDLGDGEPSESECPYYGYYNFSKEKLSGDYYKVPGADWYYEGKFWSEMPDLNLANEALRTEIGEIVSFWIDLGVDGFRLEAAKEYYSDNIPANVEVLSWFNTMVKEKKEDAYIVAEVWADMNAYAQYYESGIDSVFNFAFANSEGLIAKTVKGNAPGGAAAYGKAVAELSGQFGQYNENFIDAPFYCNHDLGRSAGYYNGEWAEAQVKMGAALNLMMNGAAFVYYGEELGMKGSGKDENKRAPMYWSEDEKMPGMCAGPKDMEDVKMKYPSLEVQKEDSYSIYNYYKQAVLLRNRYPQIARGEVAYLSGISDDKVCILKKEYEDSSILILFNLSAEKLLLNMEDFNLAKIDVDSLSLGGMLLTGEEAVSLEESGLILPPYSVAILE